VLLSALLTLTQKVSDIGIVTLPDGRHLAVAVFVKDHWTAAR
jgi:hypothetical protein